MTKDTPYTSPEAVKRLPREIWVDPDQEFDRGSVSARTAQDEYHYHRYVDKDIYESAERYWKARTEAAEAKLEAVARRLEHRADKTKEAFDMAMEQQESHSVKTAIAYAEQVLRKEAAIVRQVMEGRE